MKSRSFPLSKTAFQTEGARRIYSSILKVPHLKVLFTTDLIADFSFTHVRTERPARILSQASLPPHLHVHSHHHPRFHRLVPIRDAPPRVEAVWPSVTCSTAHARQRLSYSHGRDSYSHRNGEFTDRHETCDLQAVQDSNNCYRAEKARTCCKPRPSNYIDNLRPGCKFASVLAKRAFASDSVLSPIIQHPRLQETTQISPLFSQRVVSHWQLRSPINNLSIPKPIYIFFRSLSLK